MKKTELDTPCLILDKAKLETNLKTMADFAEKSGKSIRPHAKTHKCSKLAQMQMDYGAVGICVAKISEAEVLIDAGINSVLITSPVITHQKIDRLFKLRADCSGLMVVIDNIENAALLNQYSTQQKTPLNVLIDIDPGMGRTGVPFDEVVNFVDEMNGMWSLIIQGIQCYSGMTQHINGFAARKKDSLTKLGKAAAIFRELRGKGWIGDIFTTSGTGTYNIDIEIPEITDLQVGSYAVMDAEYQSIGSQNDGARFNDFLQALAIQTTVISVNQPGFVTVDAGLKAIYENPVVPGILSPAGKTWSYQWFGDEHGKIIVDDPEQKPQLGDIIELSPSHCDPTVNLYDQIYVVEGDTVVDTWDIDLRGKSQ